MIRYQQRIAELEQKLQAQLVSGGSEKSVVEAELGVLQTRYKAIEEKLKWSKNELEQERKNSERAIEPGKLQAVQDEVATLLRENRELRQTVSSLETERASLRSEITSLQTRLKDQAEESTANHTREATNTAERRELERELSRLRTELDSTQKDSVLKASNTVEKKELEKELSRLQIELKFAQKEASANKSLEISNATEKKELEKQLSRLRAELKSALKESADNLTHDASNSANKKEFEKELSRLRAELKSVQRESTAQITALENDLTNSRKLLTSSQNTLSELRAGAPTSILSNTEADLKADVAKEIAARKKLEKDFYTFVSGSDEKYAVLKSKLEASRAKLSALRAATGTNTAPVAPMVPLMTLDDLSRSVKRPRKEGPKTSDLSLTPFFNKHAVVTTGSPLSPSAVVVGEDTTGDDTTIVDRSMRAERSILIPSAIESSEPTRLLLVGANRKRKLPVKAAPPPPPAPIPEEESEEEAPQKPQPKKKRAKKAPEKAAPELVNIFDTPVKDESKPKPAKKNMPPRSIFDEDPPAARPVPKKRRRPVGSTQAFREDDGTGRLVLAGSSADAPGGAGLILRPPVSGVFTKEISPPKKRPEVLKRLFAKKIQGGPRGA